MDEKELDKKYLKLRIYCSQILSYYDRKDYNSVDEKFKKLKASIEQNIISI